jgi:hypothetical protein
VAVNVAVAVETEVECFLRLCFVVEVVMAVVTETRGCRLGSKACGSDGRKLEIRVPKVGGVVIMD